MDEDRDRSFGDEEATAKQRRSPRMRKPFSSQVGGRSKPQFGGVAMAILALMVGGALFLTYMLLSPSLLQGGALQGFSGRSHEQFASNALNASLDCFCTERLSNAPSSPRKKVTILLGVLTMAKKVDRRNLLRVAYGVQRSDDADFALRFVIGKPKDEEERLTIGLEAITHGDIIILDCEENMNHGKSFAYFATVAGMGVHYDYVMKLDDDSYVRTDNLAKSLAPLPREDLYYGYVLPCENQDPYAWYMAGMGYVISWDLVDWVSKSPIARNTTEGTEDKLMGDWLKEGGKAKHRMSKKPLFYDHPEFGGRCAHELIPETILIHQVKNLKRWQDVLRFFEGDRIAALVAPAVALAGQ